MSPETIFSFFQKKGLNFNGLAVLEQKFKEN